MNDRWIEIIGIICGIAAIELMLRALTGHGLLTDLLLFLQQAH